MDYRLISILDLRNTWGDSFRFSRLACNCERCDEQLNQPILAQYIGTQDKCYLWKIFEKKDGNGGGWVDGMIGVWDILSQGRIAKTKNYMHQIPTR